MDILQYLCPFKHDSYSVIETKIIPVTERVIKYKSCDLYAHVLEINVVLSRDDNGDQTVSYYGYAIHFVHLHMLPLLLSYNFIYISLKFP